MGWASFFEDIRDRFCENNAASHSIRKRNKRGRRTNRGSCDLWSQLSDRDGPTPMFDDEAFLKSIRDIIWEIRQYCKQQSSESFKCYEQTPLDQMLNETQQVRKRIEDFGLTPHSALTVLFPTGGSRLIERAESIFDRVQLALPHSTSNIPFFDRDLPIILSKIDELQAELAGTVILREREPCAVQEWQSLLRRALQLQKRIQALSSHFVEDKFKRLTGS